MGTGTGCKSDGGARVSILSALVGFLSAINRLILEFCRWAAISATVGIAVVVAISVFWRYVLNDSLTWAEELAKILMVWLVFVGAPIALRVGDHVAIQIVPNALPERLRSLLMVMISLLVVSFCSVIMVQSSYFAWNGRSQILIAIGEYSMLWVFAAIPFGLAAMLLISVQQTFEHLQNLLWPGSAQVDPFEKKYGAILRDLG